MLDEILEYQQYTQNPEDIEIPRLKYSNLKGYLTGINRAMSIVARGFMNGAFAGLSADEKYDRTKVVLQQWCGACEPEKGEDCAQAVQDWFERYLYDCMLRLEPDKEEQIGKILKKFRERLHAFNTSEFWSKNDVDTQNRVTYERIVHEAGREGALRRFYLAAKKELKRTDIDRRSSNGSTVGCGPKPEHVDLVVRTIAAYLLENTGREEMYTDSIKTRYTKVCWADIVNWSLGTYKEGTNFLLTFLWQEENIFEREAFIKQRSYTKITINPAFRNEYNWMLVREADLPEFLEEFPGYVIYRDEGAGVPFSVFTAGRDSLEEICGFKEND